MEKRGKIGQAKHDRKVHQRLDYFLGKGFSVKADLPGRAKPPKFGGRTPDIVAKKKGKLIVEEIETRLTVESDKEQRKQLKKGTEEAGGEFHTIIVK